MRVDRNVTRSLHVGALLAAGLLAGCVQETPMSYAPAPIPLQPNGPAIPYRYDPSYAAPPSPYPLQPSAPPPQSTDLSTTPASPDTTSPQNDTGAIPLNQMPTPLPETTTTTTTTDTTAGTAATSTSTNPSSGPGSNIPLEGFRPMRTQTRPTP